MRIFISHSATIASVPRIARLQSRRTEAVHLERVLNRVPGGGDDWFVVQPLNDPTMLKQQVDRLLAAGRTVYEIDAFPMEGEGDSIRLIDHKEGVKA